MNTFWSNKCGLLLSEDEAVGTRTLRNVPDGSLLEGPAATYLVALIDDWAAVPENPDETRVQRYLLDYWRECAVTLCLDLIEGVPQSLQHKIVHLLDDIFQKGINVEVVLNSLLVAPLKSPDSARLAAIKSAELAMPAVTHLFDELYRVQPHLQRVVSNWIDLPSNVANDGPLQKEDVWRLFVERGFVRNICLATSTHEAKNAITSLWFVPSLNPSTRVQIKITATDLASRLFPDLVSNSGSDNALAASQSVDSSQDHFADEQLEANTRPYEDFLNAQSQIDNIVDLIGRGKDTQARQYLTELVEAQNAVVGGRTRAVKTLCNVAQRSTHLFRYEFSEYCVQRAIELDPNDVWALIQLGNHLKDAGAVGEARNAILTALTLSSANSESRRIARNSLGDIFSKSGEYEKAIQTYQSIPELDSDMATLIAIADNRRWLGDLDGAMRDYDNVLKVSLDESRAMSGKAEVKKQLGQFHDAIKIYNSILRMPEILTNERTFFQLSLCHLFKTTGQTRRAFRLADTIVNEFPFCIAAQIQRASSLSILEGAARGLTDLPNRISGSAFDLWSQSFVRGALLLQLDRFDEARQEIAKKLESVNSISERRDFMRLATVWLLVVYGDTSNASQKLASIGSLRDTAMEYFKEVLELHIAVENQDIRTRDMLLPRLLKMRNPPKELRNAVSALARGDLQGAKRCEAQFCVLAA